MSGVFRPERAHGRPGTIRLRSATARDADRLLAWRNDSVTRSAAFTQGEVAPEEHRRWLAAKLADPRSAIFIAEDEDEGAAVGQVRIDVEDGRGELHLTVAPEARGRGHAPAILRLAVAEASRRPDVAVLEARVKAGNEASLRAFRRAGFAELPAADELVRFELALDR